MANIIISKKSIIEAAAIVSDELREKADLATQTYNEHYKNGTHTKADKANMQAATTKLAYFINNVVNAVEDEKLCSVFYYAIKASKQAPEVFFRDAMTNSYSLEKLVYLVKSIKAGKCVYSVADMSGSRVFALIDMINDEIDTFTNGAVFDLIYNPGETKLLKTAKEMGKKAMGGMPMLVWQAAAAHKIWYGADFSCKDINTLIDDSNAYMYKHFRH